MTEEELDGLGSALDTFLGPYLFWFSAILGECLG
jgi:hypothetical protein